MKGQACDTLDVILWQAACFRTARKSFEKALHGSQASSLSSNQPGFVDLVLCSCCLPVHRLSKSCPGGHAQSASSAPAKESLSLSCLIPQKITEMGSMGSKCLVFTIAS
jgi:hypothetical protein